jgi:hypothetical protein
MITDSVSVNWHAYNTRVFHVIEPKLPIFGLKNHFIVLFSTNNNKHKKKYTVVGNDTSAALAYGQDKNSLTKK